VKEKRRSDAQAGRDENDALARGELPGAFIDSKTTGPIPSEVWSGLDSGLDSGPPAMHSMSSLPCATSTPCLATSRQSV
jgi:hypothetical protein